MAERNTFNLDWRRAVVDVFLIVIGVSIALAADSWLADRTERIRTEQLLDALEDEWAKELERIDAHLEELDKAKLAIIRIIRAHDDGTGDLSTEEAAMLMRGYYWTTFKPLGGAHATLMVDGIQNVEDKALRLAIASWRTVLDELTAEQAALRELGTLRIRSIGSRIAQDSDEKMSIEASEIDYWAYGMSSETYALAAISDEEWISNQRHLLNLLHSYETQLAELRGILNHNLTLLRERTRV